MTMKKDGEKRSLLNLVPLWMIIMVYVLGGMCCIYIGMSIARNDKNNVPATKTVVKELKGMENLETFDEEKMLQDGEYIAKMMAKMEKEHLDVTMYNAEVTATHKINIQEDMVEYISNILSKMPKTKKYDMERTLLEEFLNGHKEQIESYNKEIEESKEVRNKISEMDFLLED